MESFSKPRGKRKSPGNMHCSSEKWDNKFSKPPSRPSITTLKLKEQAMVPQALQRGKHGSGIFIAFLDKKNFINHMEYHQGCEGVEFQEVKAGLKKC